MPLSKLEYFLSFESGGIAHRGFIRKDFSQSVPLSPKMHAELGEREAFSLRVGVFPLKSGRK